MTGRSDGREAVELRPRAPKLTTTLPHGPGWTYEPVWDGYPAVAVVSSSEPPRLIGRRNPSLERQFPEIPGVFPQPSGLDVYEGRIVVPVDGACDYEARQQRSHPGSQRVDRLAGSLPGSFIAYDILCYSGVDLRSQPAQDRRAVLQRTIIEEASRCAITPKGLFATPSSTDVGAARNWFDFGEPCGIDGVLARRADEPYPPRRGGLLEIRHERVAACVVVAYRSHRPGTVSTLLLGLFDAQGRLRPVGFTAPLNRALQHELVRELTGAPREPAAEDLPMDATPVAPARVIEVAYDRFDRDHFRHAVRFLRWLPNVDPRACTTDRVLGDPPSAA